MTSPRPTPPHQHAADYDADTCSICFPDEPRRTYTFTRTQLILAVNSAKERFPFDADATAPQMADAILDAYVPVVAAGGGGTENGDQPCLGATCPSGPGLHARTGSCVSRAADGDPDAG